VSEAPGRKPLYDTDDPRIYFAAERTHLAWVRTGLALMGFGFVVARFGLFLREVAAAGRAEPPRHAGLSLYVGTSLLALGVVVNVAASVKHWRTVRRLRRGEPVWPEGPSLATLVSGVLALLGVAMAAYLLGLI
jgi:putative membrane protein